MYILTRASRSISSKATQYSRAQGDLVLGWVENFSFSLNESIRLRIFHLSSYIHYHFHFTIFATHAFQQLIFHILLFHEITLLGYISITCIYVQLQYTYIWYMYVLQLVSSLVHIRILISVFSTVFILFIFFSYYHENGWRRRIKDFNLIFLYVLSVLFMHIRLS